MTDIDKRLENIREALKEPKNEATDAYIELQVLLGQRERELQKNKYKAANLKAEDHNRRSSDKWKGVF